MDGNMSAKAHLLGLLGIFGITTQEENTEKLAKQCYDAGKQIVEAAQRNTTHLGENGRVPTQTELRQIFADTGLEATLPGLYNGKYDGLISNLQIFRVDDCWRIRFSHEFFSANVGAAQNFLKSWSVAAGNRSYWNRFGSKNTYGAFLEIGVAPMPERG